MNYILCGKICSGKDEVSMLLKGTRIAFAEDLKNVARLIRINDITGAYIFLEGLFRGDPPATMLQQLKIFSCYPAEIGKERSLFQGVGMWAREYYPNIWIDATRDKVNRCKTPVIITDCRFKNELAAFPSFTSIYVEANDEIRRERMTKRDGEIKEASLTNAAELEIASLKELCTRIIYNNRTFEDLQYAVKCMEAMNEWTGTN